jgi:Fe-S oxidoreductase
MQISKQQIEYCMECGVCTGSCPVAMELDGFSPRAMIKRTLIDHTLDDPDGDDPDKEFLQTKDIWACLSCSRCSDRCPVKIDFPGFIRTYRRKARHRGNLPGLSHHGMFHTITNIQAKGVKQDRIGWARDAGRISEQGEVYYFTGCLPFYDVAFQYLDLNMIESAKNNLLLLNKLGIAPVVSDDECCCGHDAFWCGDEDTFLTLAEKNIATIAATGVRTVIFGCPEGYAMFREAYTRKLGPLPFDIIHMTEFLAKELPHSDIAFKSGPKRTVTFQDPCRLGRRSGIYDAPRQLISLVPEAEAVEMEHHRENAVCCGTTAWMECSTCSKKMQVQRLEEAQTAGAEAIITACPKCRIHLTCAQKNTDHKIEIIDLSSYLARNIE